MDDACGSRAGPGGRFSSGGAHRPPVCEWLFPTWSSPCGLVATLVVRLCLHGGLAALAANAADERGWSRSLPLALGAIAVLSAGLAVAALRRGGLGEAAADADLLLQLMALAVAGVAVGRNASVRRVLALAVVGGGVFVLGFFAMIVYGEMYVAP